ncbi:B3 domain-containing transcription factor LEC2-like [Cucurbita maxima]|uniref:B3 domain-containing transcription factor LEC2-like n=1 Tax=Cucurbita maxima TaxID=3661 RepID=A0A6J1KW90_CUCMA|nr:B3 domain-containing transcription factor LEC2-like [Cucurbita maxima]
MDDDDEDHRLRLRRNHRHRHNLNLPPFPPTTALSPPPPPQNSPVPILPHPPLGFSLRTPQSYFVPPSLVSYGFPIENDPINPLLPKDDGRRGLDAWSTKVARSKRRLARQRSLSVTKPPSSSSSSSGFAGSSDHHSKGITVTPSQPNRTHNLNLSTLSTPDKVLRILLKKELKNSDVGSLGRIVLPKREAEENLPFLTDKEGMQIVIRDVNSNKKWSMKYKYWANNRSRMYVLESTGDFVKQNGLMMGDLITLYEDDSKNFYVTIDKGEKHLIRDGNEEKKKEAAAAAATASAYPNMNIKDEEEDDNLALLIEQLKHKSEDDELPQSPCATSLLLSRSYFERGTYTGAEKGNDNHNNHNDNNDNNDNDNNGKEVEGFEDCFGDLEILPEVSGFKFPILDYLRNDRI